ncbi:MAG: UbiA family prenyltransferase [bacterium]
MGKNRFLGVFDYFFVLRPLILIPVWDFFLIGNYLAYPENRLAIKSFVGLGLYTMLMGGIYILNQINDINTDRLNKKLFILSENHMPLNNAYIEMILLWTLSLLLTRFFGIHFFILVLVSLIIGVLYSLPPVKLKGKPIFDTLSNGIGYGMLNFAAGWLMQKPFEWQIFLRFLPYFLSISAVFINTTIVDIEGDKKSGEFTTSIFLGERLSYVVSLVLMSGGVVFSIIYRDLICLIPSAMSVPLYFHTAIYYITKKRVNRPMTIVSFRLPGVVFTIITCIIYPIIIPFLFVLLIGMRIYYKKRFDIDYPSLNQG